MEEDECLLDEATTIVPSTIAQKETPNTFSRNLFQRLGIAMVTQRQRPLAPNPHIIQTANRNRNGFSLRIVSISCTSNGRNK